MSMKPSSTDIRNYRRNHSCSMYEAKELLWKENVYNAIKHRQQTLNWDPATVEEIMLELLEMINAKS